MAKKIAESENKPKRTRTVRPFPACAFSEALELANAIQLQSAGQPIRRLTLFDHLGKSPDSGTSRQLITNSNKYGLTSGGYQSETIELTDNGKLATSDDVSPREKARARVKLAIQDIAPFNAVYERFVNNKLPSRAVIADAMKDVGVDESSIDEAVDTFLVNSQFVGVLQTLSGAERFVTIDHLLETLAGSTEHNGNVGTGTRPNALITSVDADFAKTCFYVTPIVLTIPSIEGIRICSLVLWSNLHWKPSVYALSVLMQLKNLV